MVGVRSGVDLTVSFSLLHLSSRFSHISSFNIYFLLQLTLMFKLPWPSSVSSDLNDNRLNKFEMIYVWRLLITFSLVNGALRWYLNVFLKVLLILFTNDRAGIMIYVECWKYMWYQLSFFSFDWEKQTAGGRWWLVQVMQWRSMDKPNAAYMSK